MTGTLKQGFGLIQVMIALAIMALLIGVGGPTVFSYLENSRKDTTVAKISLLKNEINRFYMDTGKYPRELADLIDEPSEDDPLYKRWRGPYLEVKGGGLPQDAWDNDFYYELTPGGAHPYELFSYGKNGEDAPEEERITVW